MLFPTPPPGFSPKFHATGVYVESGQDILFLQRHPAKPEGGTWSLPGGKTNPGETPLEAAIRETYEETGIWVPHLGALGTYFVRFAAYDFVYSLFRATMRTRPEVVLRPDEHTAYLWLPPSQGLRLHLIEDEDVCIRQAYGIPTPDATPQQPL